VYASHLTVEGLVEGDLHCSEAVIVRATAQVRGNIFAPRVGIMEGATFNGRVEMDPNAAAARGGQSASARQAPRPARPGAGGTSARTAAPPATPQTPASSAAALSSNAVDQMLSTPNPARK
jgi:hypothetical protein